MENREQNGFKASIDDYGTNYYKIRNGNMPFEYDIEKKLNKIDYYVQNQNSSLVCGVLSAVIANRLAVHFSNLSAGQDILFITLLLVGYLLLKFLVWLGKTAFSIVRDIATRKAISDREEELFLDFFYKKIFNQMIYAISIVNRVKELKENPEKEKLRYIYALQGMRCVKEIINELERYIFNYNAESKQREYVEAVGHEQLLYVIDSSMECLDTIGDLEFGIDTKYEKEFLRAKRVLLEEWMKLYR